MGLGEADPVDGDGNCATLALDGDCGGAAIEDSDRVGDVSALVIRDNTS